ncbi:MAG: sodium:solute symporter family protein, partial [Desulfurococcales archaeon]|nr:sodium:solute symporter family protein [Desulfurococcales archaeon]
VGVLLGVIVMIIWSLVAGIWSVAATDALQGLWMLTAGTMLLVWLVLELRSSGLGVASAFEVLEEAGLTGPGGFWSINIFLAFTIPWMFFAVTNPQVVQRLFMPKDENSLKNMIRWFGVFGLYYTVLVVIIGLLARAAYESGALGIGVDPSDPAQRDRVTPSLLYIANPVLAAIVFTSIVAASISTVDSILLTLSSSISRDMGAGRRAGLIGLVAVAIVLAGVALARLQYIVLLSVLSSLMLLSLAPATIAGWLGRRGEPRLVAVSMLVGPVIVFFEAIRTGSVRAAFISQPLGVPVSVWILLTSTLLIIIAMRIKGS